MYLAPVHQESHSNTCFLGIAEISPPKERLLVVIIIRPQLPIIHTVGLTACSHSLFLDMIESLESYWSVCTSRLQISISKDQLMNILDVGFQE